mmetsp:Transcript_7095/g.11951  ORF Transcript_7095/g.11951 Transcript_7095/m.11951 type:complete len:597 (-) Transcript_7095:312-2102(-)
MENTQGLCPLALSLQNDLVSIGTIPESRLVLGKAYPLVLVPKAGDKSVNFLQLQEYFLQNHDNIIKAASEYGTVMFKGFDLRNGEEWASVLYASGLKEMNYVGGAAVRKLIVGREGTLTNPQVLTTNESPPSEPIPFHHELAQTPNPPSHICFFCQTNAAEGGSTPIIRSDEVFNYLNEKFPDFIKKMEEQGVKYIRTVPEVDDPSSAQGRSWKSMFHVSTKSDAEAEMTKQGFSWVWDDATGNCKVISKVLPAVKVASNGNKVFFNQILAAYTGWVDKRNEYGKSVVFADDSELPKEVIEDLEKFMNEKKCAYKWESGQFCIVDNSVAYHSREAFSGKRRVLAAIGLDTKPVTTKQTHLVLTSGDKMPSVGFGCWKVPKDQMADTIYSAITKSGYRCIDEACDYGNEKECGDGIKRAIDEGLVERKDLWVTSKLWNTFHRKEHVKEACLRSLKDLQVDYLDLYLIHFPIALKYVSPETRYPPEWIHDPSAKSPCMEEDQVPMRETWEAMEELVSEGLVKNIGFCNVGVTTLRDVLNYAKVKPSVLQVELHPYNTQERLLRFCREKGIAVTAFSNLGSASYVELGMAKENDSCLAE